MKRIFKLFIFLLLFALSLPSYNSVYANEMENNVLYITTSCIYDKPQFNSSNEPVDVYVPVKYEIEKDGVLYSYEDTVSYIQLPGQGRFLSCEVDKTQLKSQSGAIYDGDSIPHHPYVNGTLTNLAPYNSNEYRVNGYMVEYKSNNTEHEAIYLFHMQKAKFPDPLEDFGSITDNSNYVFDGWYKYNPSISKYVKVDIIEEEKNNLYDYLTSYTGKWILDSNFTFNDELALGSAIPSLNVPNVLNNNTSASWYDLNNLNEVYDDALNPNKSFELDKTYVLHIETKLLSDEFSFNDLTEVKIGEEIITKQSIEHVDEDDDYDCTLLDNIKLVKDKKIKGWYIDTTNNTLVVNYIFPKTYTVIKAMSGDEMHKPISTAVEVEYVKPDKKLAYEQLYCNYLAEDLESGNILAFDRWKTIATTSFGYKNPIPFDINESITEDIIIFPGWGSFEVLKQPTESDKTYKLYINEYWLPGQNINYVWEKSTDYGIKTVDLKPVDTVSDIILGEIYVVVSDEDNKYQVGFMEVNSPDDIKNGVKPVGNPGGYYQYVCIHGTDDIGNVKQVEMTFSEEIVESNFEFYSYEIEADYLIDEKKLTYNIRPEDIFMNDNLILIINSTQDYTITDINIIESNGTFNEVPSENTNTLMNAEIAVYRCKASLQGHIFYSASFENKGGNRQPEPTSGSSKKYKANDKDTAEKIAGSGKKGSKRTITPIEGKKVANVKVTDKDGNEIEVTMNEDGTYSFTQPACNVNVEVTYKNREIKLTIGSNVASVDDEKSNLDVCPVIRNDRTMLPIRFIAENLGAKVLWDEKNPNEVIITRGDTKIEITLGKNKAKVNGKEYELDSIAFAENDRTYLPVRFVSEALNAKVLWDESKPNDVTIIEQ